MSRRTNRPKMKEPQAIKSLLGPILEATGLSAAVARQRIVHEWPRIVSPTVARHARAERISGSILYVATDSSVWMNELCAIKSVLLEKVNAHLDRGTPPVTDIRFVQRSGAGIPPHETATPETPPLSDEDLHEIEEVLAPVKDEQLRALLRSIFCKDLQLKRLRGQEV